MTDSDENIIKVFSLRKLTTSFFIGAGVPFANYMFFGLADGGIFAILISPFLCLYNAAKLFVFVILAGLCLYNKSLNDFWFKNRHLYKTTMLIGLVGYIFGTITANNAFYDLNAQGTAQNYYYYLINPSLVIFMFSLCFRPLNNSDTLVTDGEQHADTEIEKDLTQTSHKKHTYKCDDGQLIIEQKINIPSADETAYLNGNLAPTKKYQVGLEQFIFVSNGNVYAVRGFDDK